MDPLADKLLTSAAFLALVQMGSGAGVDGGDHHRPRVRGDRRCAIARHARGVPMPASPLGKIKMVAQVVAILALILGDVYLPGLVVDRPAALWVVVADRARVGGRLLPPVQCSSRARASPT